MNTHVPDTREGFPVIVVCISDNPNSQTLLRSAKRYADKHGYVWIALHVETPSGLQTVSDNKIRKKVINSIKNITLAEEMGAKAATIKASRFDHGVLDYVKQAASEGMAIKMLIVGEHSPVLYPQSWLYRLFANQLQAQANPQLKLLRKELPASIILQSVHLPRNNSARQNLGGMARDLLAFNVWDIVCVAVALGLSSGLFFLLNTYYLALFPITNSGPFYLCAIALVAARCGFLPGLFTAAGSFFITSYFFLEPRHNFSIDSPAEAFSLIETFVFSMVVTLFVSGRREKIERLQTEAQKLQALFNVYRNSVRETSYESAVKSIHRDIVSALKTEVVFFFPSSYNTETLGFSYPYDIKLDDATQSACNACWDEARPTGFGTSIYPRSQFRFKPLLTSTRQIGVIGIRVGRHADLSPTLIDLLSSVADLVAVILERITIEQKMEEARLTSEKEKLRSMLLSSVSHDLKTPLASIIGSLSVHQNMGTHLTEDQRQELLSNAMEEAHRLDSFITNILDMTRLESRQIKFKSEWVSPLIILRQIAKRVRERLRNHELIINDNVLGNIEVFVDSILTEQVLQNIIDNAIKYTPMGTPIEINGTSHGDAFVLSIRDHGDGVPADMQESIFDKYTRIRKQDSKIAGTGLGLAIARTIMREQQGDVTVGSHPQGGAVFDIRFASARKRDDAANGNSDNIKVKRG